MSYLKTVAAGFFLVITLNVVWPARAENLNKQYEPGWSCRMITGGSPLAKDCSLCESLGQDFFEDTPTSGHCELKDGASSKGDKAGIGPRGFSSPSVGEAILETASLRPPKWEGTLSPPGNQCPNWKDQFSREKYVAICRYAVTGVISNGSGFTPGLWEEKPDPDWVYLRQFWRTGSRFYFAAEGCDASDAPDSAQNRARQEAAVAAAKLQEKFSVELGSSKFRPHLFFTSSNPAWSCKVLNSPQPTSQNNINPSDTERQARQKLEQETAQRDAKLAAQRAAREREKAMAEETARLEEENRELQRQNEEREQRRAEERRQRELDGRTAVFELKSLDTYAVHVSFYSMNRSHSWPGGDEVYVLKDSNFHSYRLSCTPGEKICFGAWRSGNRNKTWGVGDDKHNGCQGCCTGCGSSGIRTTLNAASNDAPSSSSSGPAASEVLGAVLGIGGALIGGAAGNQRRSPPSVTPGPRSRDSGVSGGR